MDPAITFPKVAIIWRLVKKILGFRTLMDVIPLDASLVKGSHGRPTDDDQEGAVFMTSDATFAEEGPLAPTAVKDMILRHVFE